jgi:hypothetical protein
MRKPYRTFLDAYGQFVECVQPVTDGFREVWRVRRGMESRASQVMIAVATAAGRAARAFQASGHLVSYKPPGTWQRTDVNPALVWSTLLDDYPMVTPDLMFTVGSQAIGVLESLRDEQADRETGMAGLLARFVRFPSRVREAAGLEARTLRGGFVSGLIVTLQGLLIAAIGGALVYPIAHWLGWTP